MTPGDDDVQPFDGCPLCVEKAYFDHLSRLKVGAMLELAKLEVPASRQDELREQIAALDAARRLLWTRTISEAEH